KKSHVNVLFAQPLCGCDLSGDDSLGIARSPAVNPSGIFGRRNEGRDGVHVRREDDTGLGLLRRGGVHVATVAFDGKLVGMVSQAAEFAVHNIAYEGFVAGDRFNIYELAREGDDIHGKEDNARAGAQTRWFFSCDGNSAQPSRDVASYLSALAPCSRAAMLENAPR